MKLIRIFFILMIMTFIGLVALIPSWRGQAVKAWDWTFGSPKALAVGFYYTCPMHPQIHVQSPGDCPICGMTLVKREETQGSGPVTKITLSDRQIQVGGIRTEPIKRRSLVKMIESVGKIDYDERSIVNISARVDGRIDKLYVNFTGATINANHALALLYSPQLVSTQKEYLIALDTLKTIQSSQFKEVVKSAEELVQAASKRLLLWGITEEQVARLEKLRQVNDHLTIYTPASGTITRKNAVEGMYVKEGDTLFEMADLSQVWLYADIYEPDIPLVMQSRWDDYYQCPMHPEQKKDVAGVCPVDDCRMPLIRHSPSLTAEVTTNAYPGEIFTGNIEFTYPSVNPETRTLRVRITIPNTELKLRPEMFARVRINIANENKLSVPESAVIHTGKRNIVFIAEGNGAMAPRQVSLGAQWLYDKDFVPGEEKALPFHRGLHRYHEVLGGLNEGEVVVTSGNFLVDAESQIQGAMETFLGDDKTPPQEPVHPPGHKH